MPKPAQGELRWTSDGPVARITIKGKRREPFALTSCRTPAEAEARCKLLAELAQRFRRAGVIETSDARQLLQTAAACAPALLAGVHQVAGELTGGELVDLDAPTALTFAKLAEQWTSGELARNHPDHVKTKDAELDEARLTKLNAIDVGGITLGEIPLDRFTLDHAESAMRQLPKEAKRPATRRAYAQLIHRVLALAVYPCRVIAASPLPRGFMPKAGRPPAYPYLYPEEDGALMACSKPEVPLCFRLLWGFLAREGCRSGEAVALRIGVDVDLERGAVSLDKNKTDDARTWALDAGVVAALRRWVELRGAKRGDPLFVDQEGQELENDKLAELLRRHLEAAGIDRPELFIPGVNRGKFRVHDLRGTFVTLSLAAGRSEAWVADRTGHTTSQMINRYRRAARSATELALGALAPLSEAVPELGIAPRLPQRQDRELDESDASTENDKQSRSGGTGRRGGLKRRARTTRAAEAAGFGGRPARRGARRYA